LVAVVMEDFPSSHRQILRLATVQQTLVAVEVLVVLMRTSVEMAAQELSLLDTQLAMWLKEINNAY
jgi:hypothetical protein